MENQLKMSYGDHVMVATKTHDPNSNIITIHLQCESCYSRVQSRYTAFDQVLNPTFSEDFLESACRIFRKKYPASCDEAKVKKIHDS
jgi:hypothetical protein